MKTKKIKYRGNSEAIDKYFSDMNFDKSRSGDLFQSHGIKGIGTRTYADISGGKVEFDLSKFEDVALCFKKEYKKQGKTREIDVNELIIKDKDEAVDKRKKITTLFKVSQSSDLENSVIPRVKKKIIYDTKISEASYEPIKQIIECLPYFGGSKKNDHLKNNDMSSELSRLKGLSTINTSLIKLQNLNICLYTGSCSYPTMDGDINVDPDGEIYNIWPIIPFVNYDILYFARCSLEDVKFTFYCAHEFEDFVKIIKDHPYTENHFTGESEARAKERMIKFYAQKGFMFHENIDDMNWKIDHRDISGQKYIPAEIKKTMDEKGWSYEDYIDEMASYFGDMAHSEYKDEKAVKAVQAWKEEGEEGTFSDFVEKNKDKLKEEEETFEEFMEKKKD